MNEDSDNDLNDVESICAEIAHHHYESGKLYQDFKKLKCLIFSKETDELEIILNLTDSHVPCLRVSTITRYEKEKNVGSLELAKENLSLKCSPSNIRNDINYMLNIVKELPKEWTLVQITSNHVRGRHEINPDKHFTGDLSLVVFNCGENQYKPLLLTCPAPFDNIANKKIELMDEIHDIMKENKASLYTGDNTHFRSAMEKEQYYSRRQNMEIRINQFIKDLQDLWLKEWQCIFRGKYVDEKLESDLKEQIKNFFQNNSIENVTERMECLIYYLTKSIPLLNDMKIKKAIQKAFPQISLKDIKLLINFMHDINKKLNLQSAKRNPIILIIDAPLDTVPFESIDILEDCLATRVPSLYILYNLYLEHKNDIRNGYKIVDNYKNGSYIVNPDLDLTRMENRLISFFNYWVPDWTGMSGVEPTEENFIKYLTSSEIFSYNGHGNGGQFFAVDVISKKVIKSVVLLFGCSSTRMQLWHPHIEMHGNFYAYFIARCPCIVGMLWEVTDRDTDILTTEFLSNWLPTTAPIHWRFMDLKRWKKAEIVDFPTDTIPSFNKRDNEKHLKSTEKDLLKSLALAKKRVMFTHTKAACVVRGLPVKLL